MAAADRLAEAAHFGLLTGFFEFPGRVCVELFAHLEGDADRDPPDLDAVVRPLRESGLPVTVAWKDGALPLRQPVFGPPRPEWALMRGLKRALDPHAVLNPGRFVEGI
ncbi:MAG: hypothetical protein M5U26_05795 [Planctomycetota bacterium]|nr:hypothetical protein [Planctomycetota bacterium]